MPQHEQAVPLALPAVSLSMVPAKRSRSGFVGLGGPAPHDLPDGLPLGEDEGAEGGVVAEGCPGAARGTEEEDGPAVLLVPGAVGGPAGRVVDIKS
ncbi:hypothetical protein ACX80F_13665 [Arthrobacter sp. TMS2-4]